MTDNTYNILKDIAQVWLPALATLVVAICTIWSLPYGESLGGSLMAIDVFLGAVLKVESKTYYKNMEDKNNE